MIRRAVLDALARAEESGRIEVAHAALARLDPLLRFFARRRLRTLTREAERLSFVRDPRHKIRLAFVLGAVGAPASNFDDVEGLEREFAASRGSLREVGRRRWFTPLVVAALAAIPLAVFVHRRLHAPFTPLESPTGALFGPQLTNFGVEVNRADRRSEAASHATPSPAAAALLGPTLVESWKALLSRTTTLSGSTGEHIPEAFDQATAATTHFDRELGQAQIPFFLDLDTLAGKAGTPLVLLLSYYVEREREHVWGDTTIRAVHLWRLDRLNVAQGYLGYTRPRTPAALVLLDQIEEDLVLRIVPALADGEPMMLVDEDTYRQRLPWELQLREGTGQAIRRYLKAAFPRTPAGIARVAQLLAKRRRLVEKWTENIAHFRLPRRLVPEADYAAELKHVAYSADRWEWDEIHEELETPELLAAFEEFRWNYVVSIERHEVQHRIDYQQEFREYPEILATALGVENRSDVAPGSFRARVQTELSAHLAQITQAPHSPTMDFLLFARHLFLQNGPYSTAARIAVPLIAEELGITAAPGLRGVERAARLVLDIAGRDAALRDATSRVYTRIYGEPVPITRVTRDVSNAKWRH